MRIWLAVAGSLVAYAPSLAAQREWHSSLYPYAYYRSTDGFWFAAHAGLSSPIGFVERPERHAASVSLNAGGSTQGSYRVVAEVQAPVLWAGWRLSATCSAIRDNRLGFYGLGNDAPYVADSVSADAPYFYRVSRTQPAARVTVQRRLVGPLRILAGVGIARSDFRALPGRSVFREAAVNGTADTALLPFTDRTVRVGVVLDTRDNELAPHSGLVVEGLFASGAGYTRTTGTARVFVHPLERLVLAARVAGEGTGGRAPLAAQIEMESSERPFLAVGGYRSLRGYPDSRFIGPGKLLGGIEVRYAPVWAPSVVEVQLVGFYDAGRVFDAGERFQISTAGLHHGWGGEVAVRVQRNSLFVVGAGVSSDGARAVLGTRWSY